jgi:heptosyltransferase II
MTGSSKYIHTQKILVATIGDLSEVLCATPFIKNLKTNWPDKRIDVLVTSKYRNIMASCPFITGVKFFNEESGIFEKISFFQSLARQYDLFVSFTPSIAGYFAAYSSKSLHRTGIVPRDPLYLTYAAKCLLTSSIVVDYSTESGFSKKFPHEIELGFKLNDELGIKTIEKEIYIEPGIENIRVINDLKEKWKISDDAKSICLYLSNTWLTQNWELNEFHKLVCALQKGYPKAYIILLYDSENADTGREVAKKFENNPLVKSSGELSIIQQAELIKRCFCVITTDRHIIQMSSAVKTPVIAIYSQKDNEVNVQRWAPWRVNNRRLLQKLPSQLINEIFTSVKELDEVT